MEESRSTPIWGRKYLIVSTNELYTEIFSGTCYGQYCEQPYYYFKDVLCIDQYNTTFNNKVEDNKLFSANDKFYDIAKIKYVEDSKLIVNKAKMARQNMEKRALDIVLKRIINETFEW
jgi:hypothetical protein